MLYIESSMYAYFCRKVLPIKCKYLHILFSVSPNLEWFHSSLCRENWVVRWHRKEWTRDLLILLYFLISIHFTAAASPWNRKLITKNRYIYFQTFWNPKVQFSKRGDVGSRTDRTGTDSMKPFQRKFTIKTYLVKFRFVILTLHGFKVP
jgi:hypothetical protein